MKKIFFILIILCSVFHLMGQAGNGLQIITEGGNTGWRLFGMNANYYGDIGIKAVDLSSAINSSSTRGATGNNSIATGFRTIAAGITSTAMGHTTTAAGDNSTAMGYTTTASGQYSIAMGHTTTAAGDNSTAMGYQTTADGNYSTALGYRTNANELFSAAMGRQTTAAGISSTAMGRNTTASGYGSTAIGTYNTINNNADPTSFDFSNRAFVIGNGTFGNLSDALTVLFDGRTTIAGSVTAPSFIGDGSLLTNLPKAGLDKVTEGPNAGWRLAGQNSNRYGAIGMNAVDLSISEIPSSVLGATGSSAVAMGYQNTASEFASTAMGRGTTASGVASTAMGTVTIASGGSSTAMGEATTASGSFSTAMGNSVIASGNSSTAIGRETMASGYGTTAIGIYNTINNNAIATSFDYNNRAFVIGNGTDNANRSDALTVLFDGTTTIAGSMTATSFTGDGSALTNLPVAGLDQITEGSNTGWRLAGNSSSNYGDIGRNAVDLSFSNNPSSTNGATGMNSIAMGISTIASGDLSLAYGDQSLASGDYSTASGQQTIASQNYSMASGIKTRATGSFSSASGRESMASGAFSSASGIETMASGDFSSASGIQTIASGYGTMAIGSYNTTYSKANPTTFDPVNRAFVIGNGQDGSNRSDAFTVYFDGTAILAGDLTVHSDRRLKTNISSLGSTLANLRMLDGKKYYMKSDKKQGKIGMLAQDVQKVFPELVKTSNDESGTLSLNYQGLIPVLINAVNEQQEVIDTQETKLEEQKERIDDQQKQIDELKAMMAKILESQE